MRYRLPYSLYKRGKFWYYRTYNADGVRTSGKSTGCTSKAKAICFLEELIKYDKLTGEVKESAYDYFYDFFSPNSIHIKDRVMSESTLSSYNSYLKNHILPAVKGLSLSDITYKWLKEYRIKLSQNYAGNTVHSIMQVLSQMLDIATREEKIIKNPCNLLEPMHNRFKKRDAFTFDEMIIIFKTLTPAFSNFAMFMALTGMRVSEAIGVRTEDVKEKNGIFYIDLKEQEYQGKRKTTKNNKERIIPIIPEVKNMVSYHMCSTRYYQGQVKIVCENFENYEKRMLSTHSIRHFFITNSKAYGINPTKVETIAGHSLKGIEGVYTNYKLEDLTDILKWQTDTLNKIKKALCINDTESQEPNNRE